jgi:uncharacterized protein (TIGR02271 family)
MSSTTNIDWNDVIKKEARGNGDEDLGEVQEVGQDYVLVQRGMLNKEKFYVPRDLVESYDGNVLRFRISEEDAKSRFLRDSPIPSSEAYRDTSTMPRRQEEEKDRTIQETEETTVPLTEEKLDVSKRTSAKEATITKKPVTETKTVEVPVTHEEISVERRPTSSNTTTTTTADSPVESEEEIRVPLKEEEVEVTKKPYVKEEVSVKKKPVTETRRVSQDLRREEVKVKGAAGRKEEEISEDV